MAAAEPVYGAREAAAIARLVAERRWGLSRADCALNPNAEVAMRTPEGFNPSSKENSADSLAPSQDTSSAFGDSRRSVAEILPSVLTDGFDAVLSDLAAARPVQYILGVADFDDMELAVGEGVLIPRPETEELVRWISTSLRGGETDEAIRKIMDIGTGSGAIAIALAKRLPGAQVTAIDISPEALKYARQNNEKYSAGVEFLEADILDPLLDPGTGPYDVIVSNPPYIPAAEKGQMAANVTEYEPASALFVPDDDPLIFYRAIARFAHRGLAPGGALYFEIHEGAADGVAELLKAEGFAEVEVRNDINSKPRFVIAKSRIQTHEGSE